MREREGGRERRVEVEEERGRWRRNLFQVTPPFLQKAFL